MAESASTGAPPLPSASDAVQNSRQIASISLASRPIRWGTMVSSRQVFTVRKPSRR